MGVESHKTGPAVSSFLVPACFLCFLLSSPQLPAVTAQENLGTIPGGAPAYPPALPRCTNGAPPQHEGAPVPPLHPSCVFAAEPTCRGTALFPGPCPSAPSRPVSLPDSEPPEAGVRVGGSVRVPRVPEVADHRGGRLLRAGWPALPTVRLQRLPRWVPIPSAQSGVPCPCGSCGVLLPRPRASTALTPSSWLPQRVDEGLPCRPRRTPGTLQARLRGTGLLGPCCPRPEPAALEGGKAWPRRPQKASLGGMTSLYHAEVLTPRPYGRSLDCSEGVKWAMFPYCEACSGCLSFWGVVTIAARGYPCPGGAGTRTAGDRRPSWVG